MTPAIPALPSYASGTSDVPLLGDTIGDNLDRTVAADPGREALVDVPSGRRWTYGEFRADVDALALGLLADGVEKGDRVGRVGRAAGGRAGRGRGAAGGGAGGAVAG